VFNRAVMITFVSYPYMAGEPDDGYEMRPIETARAALPDEYARRRVPGAISGTESVADTPSK